VSSSHAKCDAKLKDKLAGLWSLIGGRLEMRRGNWITLPESAQPSGRPQITRHLFTAEETAAIQEHCRRERTTIGGAMFATAVSALAEVVPDPEFRYRCRIPTNRSWRAAARSCSTISRASSASRSSAFAT
jgi:hypothetical protein